MHAVKARRTRVGAHVIRAQRHSAIAVLTERRRYLRAVDARAYTLGDTAPPPTNDRNGELRLVSLMVGDIVVIVIVIVGRANLSAIRASANCLTIFRIQHLLGVNGQLPRMVPRLVLNRANHTAQVRATIMNPVVFWDGCVPVVEEVQARQLP